MTKLGTCGYMKVSKLGNQPRDTNKVSFCKHIGRNEYEGYVTASPSDLALRDL